MLVAAENQAGVELVPIEIGTGTATIHGEAATLSAACTWWTLVRGFPCTRVSVRSSTPTLRALLGLLCLLYKGEQYRSPWCNDQWRETCVGSEVCVDDTSQRSTLQLLHECRGRNWELNAYLRILEMYSCPNSTLAKELRRRKNNAWP
jgi:hypothetical protein